MFIKLLILFIAVPAIEVYVLLAVGHLIGLWSTISLIFLTGIAGAYLARTQGSDTARRIQLALQNGEMPTEDLLDGAMIFAGGLTLLTPGFCTDMFGFCLLFPATRNIIKDLARTWFKKLAESSQMHIRHY